MRTHTIVTMLSLLGALALAPASARADASHLLLREPAEVAARCWSSPTETRGVAERGDVRLTATDAGLVVERKGRPPRLLTTCDGLLSNRVTGVAADTPDATAATRWLVSSMGGGVVRLTLGPDGALEDIEPITALPPLRVTSVVRVGDAIWAGTPEEGLWRIVGVGVGAGAGARADQPVRKLRTGLVSALAVVGSPREAAGERAEGETAASGGDARLLVGRGRRGLWALDPQAPGTSKPRRLIRGRWIQRIDPVFARGAAEARRARVHTPAATIDVTLRVRRGRVRLFVQPAKAVSEAPRPPRVAAGAPGPHVTTMAVHGGELWVGTFNHGLSVFDGERWRTVDISAAPSVLGYVNDLESDGGSLWLASPNGAARWDGERWRIYGPRDGLAQPDGRPSHVNAVLPTDDAVWFATSRGVIRVDARGPVRFGRAHGLPGRIVYDLAIDDDGRLIAGTNRGAARSIRPGAGRFEAWTHEGGHLSDNWANAVQFWEDDLWVGTYDRGVDRRSIVPGPGDARTGEAVWRPAPTASPLWVNPGGLFALDAVLAVAALGDGLWARAVDGAWVSWTDPLHVPDPDVTAVQPYAGRLWIGTRAGLVSWN